MSRFVEGQARWASADGDSIRYHSIAAQHTDSRRTRRGNKKRAVRLAHQVCRHRQTLRALAIRTAAVEVYVRIEIRSRGNGGSSAGSVTENRDAVVLKTPAHVRLETNLVDVVKVRYQQASLRG